MDRLPELIAAFMAMDHFARNVIVDSAIAYARARAYSSSRGQLRSLPCPRNDHPVLDGVGGTQEEGLIGIGGEPVDEE